MLHILSPLLELWATVFTQNPDRFNAKLYEQQTLRHDWHAALGEESGNSIMEYLVPQTFPGKSYGTLEVPLEEGAPAPEGLDAMPPPPPLEDFVKPAAATKDDTRPSKVHFLHLKSPRTWVFDGTSAAPEGLAVEIEHAIATAKEAFRDAGMTILSIPEEKYPYLNLQITIDPQSTWGEVNEFADEVQQILRKYRQVSSLWFDPRAIEFPDHRSGR